MSTTHIDEENKSMFRRGEERSSQETTRSQRAPRQRSRRPTQERQMDESRLHYGQGKRKYKTNKHQTTTRKSSYSSAPPKPTSVGKKLKGPALNTDKTSSPCPCSFVPHDTLLTERPNDGCTAGKPLQYTCTTCPGRACIHTLYECPRANQGERHHGAKQELMGT